MIHTPLPARLVPRPVRSNNISSSEDLEKPLVDLIYILEQLHPRRHVVMNTAFLAQIGATFLTRGRAWRARPALTFLIPASTILAPPYQGAGQRARHYAPPPQGEADAHRAQWVGSTSGLRTANRHFCKHHPRAPSFSAHSAVVTVRWPRDTLPTSTAWGTAVSRLPRRLYQHRRRGPHKGIRQFRHRRGSVPCISDAP